MKPIWKQVQISRNIWTGLLKAVADIALINLSVFISLVVRILYMLGYVPLLNTEYKEILWNHLHIYADSAWILSILCVVVFTLNGFYTDGRLYRGRFKFLIVIQAITLVYLIFGAFTYLSQGIFFNFLKGYLTMPRGALMVSWALSTVFLVGTRVGSTIWRQRLATAHEVAAPVVPKVRRALVIGGAGYIGSALVPLLLEQGFEVRVLDLLIYGKEPLSRWLDDPRLEIIQADFRQIDQVVSAMQDVDAVIHLGAIVGDPACTLDEGLTLEINLVATRVIAEIAKGYGVRYFVFASTCSVYGASDHVLDEQSDLKPTTLYSRSKAASEKVLLKMADENFAPVILRFGTVYGLSGRYRFDLVVNLLTAKALFDGEITIFGGSQWRSFLHVEDAARSIVSILDAPREVVSGQVFNVGSDEQNYTITRIGEMIHSYVPTATIINNFDEVDHNDFQVGFSKIHKALGFSPRWTVEMGIEQVRDAILSGQISDYRRPEYSNIKFLTQGGITYLDRHESGWAARLLDELNIS